MENNVLAFLKARLGITKNNRDEYLTQIIKSIISELKNIHGIVADENREDHIMFIIDYADYRYNNRTDIAFPRHLQFRLHNLIISKAGAKK